MGPGLTLVDANRSDPSARTTSAPQKTHLHAKQI